jgi:hypothetical protein
VDEGDDLAELIAIGYPDSRGAEQVRPDDSEVIAVEGEVV